jgi:hypothetical protein
MSQSSFRLSRQREGLAASALEHTDRTVAPNEPRYPEPSPAQEKTSIKPKPPTTPKVHTSTALEFVDRPQRAQVTPSEKINESPVSQTPVSQNKRQTIHDIVRNVTPRTKSVFGQARDSGDSGPSSLTQSSPSETPVNSSRTAGPSLPNTTSSKRKLADRDDTSSDHDDDDERHLINDKDAKNNKDQNSGGYACPYFKHNPARYKGARNCPGPGWPNVHRVK